MRSLKDICNVNISNSLHSLLEGLLRGEEATLIDGDEIVKRPEIVLGVKCKDINEVADVISKCIGQKIKVKKMSGKWYVDGFNFGPYIDVKGCPGFAIERIGKAHFGDAPIRKLWFAVWEGRLICKQEIYDYRRKTASVLTPEYTSNPKNYTKHRTSLGLIGSGTMRNDWMYHWGEDTLWDWFVKSGFERFFDKI
jgi:hypothetical protein